MALVEILVAIGIGTAIWFGLRWMLKLLATPPPEVNPEDVVPVDQDYRCTICGTELTVKVQNLMEASPPKHCREEMVPISRPLS